MSNQEQSGFPDAAEFTRLWSDWLSQTERQWNAALNEAMSTDEFGQSLGGMMDLWLAMQKTVGEQMARYLNSLNMPSRSDILSINDRLLEIENRLAQIESKLATRPRFEGEEGPGTRPSRTRRPPEAGESS